MKTALLAELNAGYKCPADAGPAWRKAVEMGIDMSLVECNLEMSPRERLLENDRALALVREVQQSFTNGELSGILKRLYVAEVQFVLVGGLAAVKHGCSYVINDVDICVPLEADNFRRITTAISDLHPRFRQRRDLNFELKVEMLSGLKDLSLATDLGPLDCLGEIAGVGGYSEVLKQSEAAKFPFGEIQVLTLSSLIKAKETIGRPQDLIVASQLGAIQERLNDQK